jgi:hypothetical protein
MLWGSLPDDLGTAKEIRMKILHNGADEVSG